MKKSNDPRHITRVKTVKELFASSFGTSNNQISTLTSQVVKNINAIDILIKKNAPAWPINQISPIDLAVLRLAIFELNFQKKKQPFKVIVDEAVEIAKEFGNDTSGAFVNGALGSIIKSKEKES